jgi:hypothetical protein
MTMRNGQNFLPLYFAVLLVAVAAGLLILLSERSLARELMQILSLIAGTTFFSGLLLLLGYARTPRNAPLVHINFNGRYLQDELAKVIDAEFTEIPSAVQKQSVEEGYADDDLVLALAKVRIDLERMIREIAERVGLLRSNNRFDLSRTLSVLEQRDVLPYAAVAAVREILPVCNRAIHGETIDWASARSVIDVAREVMVILEGVRYRSYSGT